jgi:putative transposase
MPAPAPGRLGDRVDRDGPPPLGWTYGAPRVHAQLRRDGTPTSRQRVERLLRAAGYKGRSCAGAGVARPGRTLGPRQRPTWSTGTSLHLRRTGCGSPTARGSGPGEGPRWLACVRDGFSRRIVGWKASDRADTELVLGALEYAIWGRGVDGDPAQRRLIHHADRGAQYTAIRFTQRLADAGIQPSMGSVGASLDNALAENFFSILKVERVYRTSYRTREEAELDLFRYIDGWYNPHRIQRELGWLSPNEYEEASYTHMASGSLASPTGAR